MRHYFIKAALALGFAAFAATSFAQIASTKHNLGSSGTGVTKFSGTTEICVFCHTPHAADTSAVVPLWNRSLPAAGTFTTYDSLGTTTLDGKTAGVGSVSIACLSCHDGTQAMNSVINAPGSGLAGDAAWAAGTWSGIGAGKVVGVANIGTDLQNDHPIGIQYGGGGLKESAPAAATRDPDFRVATNQIVNGNRVWWVDTGVADSARQKSDMILYSRASTAGYVGQTEVEPFVECASCHDPHSANATFLRIQNTGSAVCLACHIK